MSDSNLPQPPIRSPLFAIKQAWKDFMEFPGVLKRSFGTSIDILQRGGTPVNGYKRLGNSGTPQMHQLFDDLDGNTYRVLLVLLPTGVYVLHAFMKKSTKGIATPKPDMDVAKQRRQQAMDCDARVALGGSATPPVEKIGR